MYSMNGLLEIPQESLPKRENRGKVVELYIDKLKHEDPRIIGWRKLKKDNFTCLRKDRHAGLEYLLEQLVNSGTSFKEIYDIVENIENMREADPDKE